MHLNRQIIISNLISINCTARTPLSVLLMRLALRLSATASWVKPALSMAENNSPSTAVDHFEEYSSQSAVVAYCSRYLYVASRESRPHCRRTQALFSSYAISDHLHRCIGTDSSFDAKNLAIAIEQSHRIASLLSHQPIYASEHGNKPT